MTTPFTGGRVQVITAAGVQAGAKVYTYAAGTLTPLATFTNQDLANPSHLNANPVVCDSNGQCVIWPTPGVAYRYKVETSAGVPLTDDDNIATFAADSFDPTTDYVTGTFGWALKQSEWSVGWFDDVVGDGVTDDTAAIAAVIALKTAAGGGSLFFPRTSGGYLLNGAAGSDSYKNGILLPFTTVNPSFSSSLQLRGESGTVFKAGSDTMMVIRCARNNVVLRDIVIDGNGHTSVWGLGIVPESITQTTTQVSQQFIDLYNVHVKSCLEGLVIQPGPTVAAADSGCFYMNFHSFSGDTNTRHVYLKKNADWATHANKPTRIAFFGPRLLRGNTGYYLEVGSEVEIHSGFEELIATGSSPLATPTARYVTSDCSNIRFFGGYTETSSASATLASNNVSAFGYIPASGATTTWRQYASGYEDAIDDSRTWTPVITSSGGGAQGSSTSTGWLTKHGRVVHFTATVSVGKGTLGAGNISITGFPFTANASAGTQQVPCPIFTNFTFSNAANTAMAAFVTAGSATLNLRKSRNDGAADTSVTVAEAAATIAFTIQGSLLV